MASASPRLPSWVILSSILDVAAAAELRDVDLSVALAAPPRVTLLTVPPRVSPGPGDALYGRPPCVLVADPSGLLLVQTPPPRSPNSSARPRAAGLTVRVAQAAIPGYYVCDVASATAFRLPNPKPPAIFSAGNLGLVAAPGGSGRYMVAELQYVIGDEQATLLCFSSESGEWIKRKIPGYPPPLRRWIWGSDGVISHDGKLWWVDLAGALVSCDPFADEPELALVPLPRGDVLPGKVCCHCTGKELSTRRLVQVTDGKFRCVEMSCAHPDNAADAATTVSVWTLVDQEAKKAWTREYQACFADIWSDASYVATGLRASTPAIALVHPRSPRVVYFFMDERLFAVDLREKVVVECADYAPPGGMVCAGFVLPWELPPALSAGLPDDTDNGRVSEESSAPPATAPAMSEVEEEMSRFELLS